MNRLQILHRSSTPGRRFLAINAQRHRLSSLTSSSLSSSGLCHHHQTTNNQYYHSRSSFQFKRDGLHAALTSSIDTISSRHDRNNRNINNVYSTTGNANSIIHNFPSSRRNYHSTPTTTLSTKTITPIDLLSSCPEFTPTLYGLSGLLLTTFHTQLHLPYWACISLTSIVVRTSIVPLVVQGAKTQLNFGKVAPEVQYLISMFQNDFKKLKLSSGAAAGGDTMQNKANQLTLVKYTLQTLRGVFRLHKVNLLDMFKSPLLQIPIFWYFSIDIRKIIHGSDPQLAQQLVESSFLWIPDLTEPDPWYGLPILTGMLLYLNVEMAMGRKALSGEASSRSNMGIMMKDFFQSLAVFMPCFMAQQPAGVQIYLATSMVFSLTQSLAMRTDSIRHSIGLPSLHAKPKGMHEGLYVQEFMQQMQERQEAKERGEFVLGEGVLKMGAPMATLGEKRKSSIVVDNMDGSVMEFNEMISSKSSSSSSLSSLQGNDSMKMIEIASIIHTPPSLLVDPERFNNNNKNLSMRPTPLLPPEMPPTFDAATATMIPSSTTNISSPTSLFNNDNKNNNTMPQISISAMEAANRGERPVELAPKEIIQQREEQKKRMSEAPIDVTKLKSKWSRQKGSSAGGRQQQGRKPSLGGGGGGRGGKKSGGR